MKFEVGKTYQHSTGKRMTIIGRLKTHIYGECLIGERDTGELVPVGELEENAVNWHEHGKEGAGMKADNGNRYCDRCGVLLTENNNKCGFEICDKCNEWLVGYCSRVKKENEK